MLIVNTKCKIMHFFDKNVSFLCLDKIKQQNFAFVYIVSKMAKGNTNFLIFLFAHKKRAVKKQLKKDCSIVKSVDFCFINCYYIYRTSVLRIKFRQGVIIDI